jgi:hypothetical protein
MRDKSLDVIKGLACILMILAHSKTLGRTLDNSFTEPFWYLGFFAPVLFFASVGASLTFQLEKRKAIVLIIFNIILFIISFGDRARESLTYFNITSPNLIAALALASIFAIIFRRFNGLVLFIVLLTLDRLLNKFQIQPTIFYGLLFSVIPWAGLTTLGKYLKEKQEFRIYLPAIGVLMTLYYYVFKNHVITEQFLTSLFLGVSFVIYGLVTLFAGRIAEFPSV